MKNSEKYKNVEALLLMAKYDEEFYNALFLNREKAIADTGLPLSTGERLVLTQVSDEKLAQAVKTFRVPGISETSLPSWKKALHVVILVTSIMAATGCCPITTPCEGIAPDEPEPEPTERPIEEDIV